MKRSCIRLCFQMLKKRPRCILVLNAFQSSTTNIQAARECPRIVYMCGPLYRLSQSDIAARRAARGGRPGSQRIPTSHHRFKLMPTTLRAKVVLKQIAPIRRMLRRSEGCQEGVEDLVQPKIRDGILDDASTVGDGEFSADFPSRGKAKNSASLPMTASAFGAGVFRRFGRGSAVGGVPFDVPGHGHKAPLAAHLVEPPRDDGSPLIAGKSTRPIDRAVDTGDGAGSSAALKRVSIPCIPSSIILTTYASLKH
jgi:hypothetical protein